MSVGLGSESEQVVKDIAPTEEVLPTELMGGTEDVLPTELMGGTDDMLPTELMGETDGLQSANEVVVDHHAPVSARKRRRTSSPEPHGLPPVAQTGDVGVAFCETPTDEVPAARDIRTEEAQGTEELAPTQVAPQDFRDLGPSLAREQGLDLMAPPTQSVPPSLEQFSTQEVDPVRCNVPRRPKHLEEWVALADRLGQRPTPAPVGFAERNAESIFASDCQGALRPIDAYSSVVLAPADESRVAVGECRTALKVAPSRVPIFASVCDERYQREVRSNQFADEGDASDVGATQVLLSSQNQDGNCDTSIPEDIDTTQRMPSCQEDARNEEMPKSLGAWVELGNAVKAKSTGAASRARQATMTRRRDVSTVTVGSKAQVPSEPLISVSPVNLKRFARTSKRTKLAIPYEGKPRELARPGLRVQTTATSSHPSCREIASCERSGVQNSTPTTLKGGKVARQGHTPRVVSGVSVQPNRGVVKEASRRATSKEMSHGLVPQVRSRPEPRTPTLQTQSVCETPREKRALAELGEESRGTVRKTELQASTPAAVPRVSGGLGDLTPLVDDFGRPRRGSRAGGAWNPLRGLLPPDSAFIPVQAHRFTELVQLGHRMRSTEDEDDAERRTDLGSESRDDGVEEDNVEVERQVIPVDDELHDCTLGQNKTVLSEEECRAEASSVHLVVEARDDVETTGEVLPQQPERTSRSTVRAALCNGDIEPEACVSESVRAAETPVAEKEGNAQNVCCTCTDSTPMVTSHVDSAGTAAAPLPPLELVPVVREPMFEPLTQEPSVQTSVLLEETPSQPRDFHDDVAPSKEEDNANDQQQALGTSESELSRLAVLVDQRIEAIEKETHEYVQRQQKVINAMRAVRALL